MLQEIHLQAEITLLPGQTQKITLDQIRNGFGHYVPSRYKNFKTHYMLQIQKTGNLKIVHKLVITNCCSKQITLGTDKVLGYWVSLILINHA